MKSNSMPKLMLLASVLSTSGAYAFAESKTTVSDSFVKERTATIENLIVSQKQKITGTILDQAGEPMIGVNVIIKGTSTGTITDLDGNFTLDADPGETLEISYIGYKPILLKATKQPMKVKMQEDLQNLDEVVVVGYGVTKKANLTGSVSSIKAEALQSRPVSSVSAALAGQMPGVTSIQRSGAPGGQAGSITIRGKNSINAASPLVIVDGVPGSMDTIDPNDIESLTVLKDASSSAIYGVQAANGVILITTKQGKKGERPRVSYSGNVSLTSPVTRFKFLGAADYATLYNEATLNENPNAVLKFTPEDIELYRNGTSPYTHPDTDWYNETFKKHGFETMHNVSINGGTEKTTYNASIGFTQQNGIVDANKYRRFNARSVINSEITKWLSAGLNLSGYRGTSYDGWDSASSLVQFSNRINPTVPVYNEDGSFHYMGQDNPVANKENSGHRKDMNQQVNGTVNATINILPNLSVKGLFSVRNDYQNKDGFKKNFKYGQGSNIKDSGLREGYEEYYTKNWYTTQVLANYNEKWGKHGLTALLGFEQVDYNYKYTKATRKGGGNNELGNSLNTLDKASQTNEDGGNGTARRSYFGRAQYDFADRYLFEANVRFDASSRFPKDNRWGAFPAFSAAWRITEEDFMKDIDQNWLSNLKLRLGWGRTGNEELKSDDIYPSIATYAYEKYMLGNSLYSTAYEKRYVNPNLRWATVENYEIGLEAGFFENKLNLEVAAYRKDTKDMLLYLPVQGVLGMNAPAQNAGSVRNTGFDLQISHNNSVGTDFRYDLIANVAYVHNKITNMEGTEGPNPDNGKYWYIEGESIGSFYGYKANGFFNTQEELDSYPKRTGKEKLGDIKYVDLNGDGKINGDDRTVIGTDFPKWTAGLGANFYYKNFDLSMLFQGAFDVSAYYTGEAAYAFYNGGKVMERHLDRWTPDNHDASYPRLTISDQKNFETSSFWLQNTSYVRLKNLSIGYTLPTAFTNKAGIERVKVFITGENLFTITGLDGIDPESPADTRGDYYSNVRKYSLGLKVTF